jgi:hypothetical protein
MHACRVQSSINTNDKTPTVILHASSTEEYIHTCHLAMYTIFSKFIHLHKKHGSSKQPSRSTYQTFVHNLQSCSSPSCQIANNNTAWVGTKESGTINLYNNNTAFRSLSIVIQINQKYSARSSLFLKSPAAARTEFCVSMIYQSEWSVTRL